MEIETRHTRGPWDCYTAKVIESHEKAEGLTGYWYLIDGPGMAMCRANCELIEAAPDLLEAAKVAAQLIRTTDPDRHALKLLDAAITKAEGGAA